MSLRFKPRLACALLSLLPMGCAAQAKPIDEPAGAPAAVASVRLSQPADTSALNAVLAAYAFQDQPAASAEVRTQTLVQYLTGLGYRHVWQVDAAGDLVDAFYSASSDISVLCTVQRGNSVSMQVYAVAGKVRKNEVAG